MLQRVHPRRTCLLLFSSPAAEVHVCYVSVYVQQYGSSVWPCHVGLNTKLVVLQIFESLCIN